MLAALANSEGGNGVYHYGASAFPDDQRSTPRTTGSTPTFDRTVPPDTRGPVVTDTTPVRTRRATSPATATVTATFDEQLTASTVNGTNVHAARRRAAAPGPATVTYDAQTRTAKLAARRRRSRTRATYTRDAQGRRRRRHRRRRQPAGRRQDLDVHDRRPVADRGPGRPDPRPDRPDRQVRHLLRGDPARGGPQRVRASPSAPVTAATLSGKHHRRARRPRR